MLSVDTIDHNVARQRAQLERLLAFEGPGAARLRNNAEWLRPLGLMEFLRDAGRHFTVNYMLAKDSVKSRLESGMSFAEFTYMLIQAYDFWHLWKTERCELQMGGSDQWGNITAGTELLARKEGACGHGLVLPLLTTSSGAKFGKSEEGAVYLDAAKTSPYKFYQFWLNADDRDVERWLRFFTFYPIDEIAEVAAEHGRDPGRRVAQRRLAEEMTTRIHGAATTASVVAASRLLFGGGDLRATGEDAFAVLARELPTFAVARDELGALGLLAALVRSGLASSKGDARRGVQGKGFSINGQMIAGAEAKLSARDLLAGKYVMLQKGKKSYALGIVG